MVNQQVLELTLMFVAVTVPDKVQQYRSFDNRYQCGDCSRKGGQLI
jgi:hypothetical protein